MKKKLFLSLGLIAASCATVALSAGCAKDTSADVFHIYCWNKEFRGFFEKYVSDEGKANNGAVESIKTFHLEGKEVKWTENPSDGGAYQKALDEGLKRNKKAKRADKIDLFLAEADYILKYTNSKFTADAKAIGVKVGDDQYQYTIDAASDANGVMKGVSFQCCPSGMIYRRSLMKKVIGTDDPAQVQEAVSTWEKWEKLGEKCAQEGILLTGSYADSFRVFSNNATAPWVNDKMELTIPQVVTDWMGQAERMVAAGTTQVDGVWDDGKTATFTKSGVEILYELDADGNPKKDANGDKIPSGETKTHKQSLCTFGPAWYYNFCMGPAMGDGTGADNEANKDCTYGDWAVVKGPQAHFWGGTWALLPTGGDDNELAAKVMNTIIGKEFSMKLLENEGQYTNNKSANGDYATSNTKGNGFLGGQNDTAIWNSMASEIKFKNVTNYDQQCNEGLQTKFVLHLKDSTKVTKEQAINNFYEYINTEIPAIKTPAVTPAAK